MEAGVVAKKVAVAEVVDKAALAEEAAREEVAAGLLVPRVFGV